MHAVSGAFVLALALYAGLSVAPLPTREANVPLVAQVLLPRDAAAVLPLVDYLDAARNAGGSNAQKTLDAIIRGSTRAGDGAAINDEWNRIRAGLQNLQDDPTGRKISNTIYKSRGRFLPALRFAGRLTWTGIAITVGMYAIEKLLVTDEDGQVHEEVFRVYEDGTWDDLQIRSGDNAGIWWFFDGAHYYLYVTTPSACGTTPCGARNAWQDGAATVPDAAQTPNVGSYNAATGIWGTFQTRKGSEWLDNDATYCGLNLTLCFTNPAPSLDSFTAKLERYTNYQAYANYNTLPGARFERANAPSTSCSNNAPNAGHACFGRRATEAEMRDKMHLVSKPSGGADSAAATQTSNFTQPAIAQSDRDDFVTKIKEDLDTEKVVQELIGNDPDWGGMPHVDMPDCRGLHYLACQTALASLGFQGAYIATPAAPAQAVMAYGPGAVIYQAPVAGIELSVGSIVLVTYNPLEMPLAMPQPGPNETYTNYLNRLRAMGWLGAATTSLNDPYDPVGGPGTPTTVTINGTVTGTGSWSFPRIGIHEPALFGINGPEAPPVDETAPPDEGGRPGVSVPPGPGGTGLCVCPPLDFAALSSVPAGDKFPFGLPGYISGFFGQLSVAPERPAFAVSRPPGLAPGTWSFDFAAAEAYRETGQTVVNVIAVLASVYWLASMILGFGRGERLEGS